MILRRVIAHFKKQEWTAIAIDFLIVVVGVFIGIQVSNWNAARADQVRAYGFLERIRADLDVDLVSYRDRLGFWRAVSGYGAKGLAYAETGETEETKWQILLAFFQASQVAEQITTNTTYEELKSTGELGLIGDIALRGSLASYYTNAANPVMTERPAYREHVRGVIPLGIQLYIWENCYSSDSATVQELHDCASPVSEEQAAEIADSIRRSDALMAELRYWISSMHIAAVIASQRIEVATNLREAVDEKTARR